MAENVIGRFTLPFAVCPDVLVDGITYQVPMVTEEPSVVAASYASKLIKRSGGFTTMIHNRQMIGQVALLTFLIKPLLQVKFKRPIRTS